MWNKVAAIALLAALYAAPSSAYAGDRLATGDADLGDAYDYEVFDDGDDGPVYDDYELHFKEKHLEKWLVVDAYSEWPDKVRLQSWFRTVNSDFTDSVKVTVYVSKNKGKYKKVGSKKVSMQNLRHKTLYAMKVKPDTRCDFRFVCVDEHNGVTVTKRETTWTPLRQVSKVKGDGASHRWKKVKGARGYLVRYRHLAYEGKNMFGVDTYRQRVDVKLAKRNKVKLGDGETLLSVYPWTKHKKLYYVERGRPNSSLEAMFTHYTSEGSPIYM